MSIYQLKSRFQDVLRPVTRYCHARGITANQVTLLACFVSVLLGLMLAIFHTQSGLFALLPIWMGLRMALNAIDGMLAREFHQQSHLGAYLNELCDLISDVALYLPFALLSSVSPLLVLLVVILALISEYAGVLGKLVGATRRYDGPMGKSDRAFVFGLLGIAVAVDLPLFWVNGCLLLMAILLLRTTQNRVKNGIKEVASTTVQ